MICGAAANNRYADSHIEVNSQHNGNLFFWHFQNRHIANRQRTVIWLNGGPGCSSMDGALMEVGPYRLRDDSHLEYNEGAWDEFANILFIDNPVGTGFSYVDTNSYVHELDDMADNMVKFLEQFFDMFPEYRNDDVSSAFYRRASSTDQVIALHIRRVLCRTAYPLHCSSYPRPQQITD